MTALFRFAEEHDAADVQEIYAPFCEASPVSFETAAPPAEEMARRIEKISRQFPWLICEHGGRVAGYVYACPHRERAAYQWSVDVAVYIGPAYRRAGLGRSLYASLFQVLALQGYYKAYAGVTLPNPASVGLHLAAGFEPVGVYHGVGFKLGRWHDVAWYQKALQPESPDPVPPRSIRELRDTPAVLAALQAGAALVRIEGPA